MRFLGAVLRAIINTGDAALVAANMIEHCLDDVRLYAKLGHSSRHRAPQIVMHPSGQGMAAP